MRTRGNRRQEILQALALMLESHPGHRITTAALAAQIEADIEDEDETLLLLSA